MRQSLEPAVAPIVAEHAAHLFAQALLDGRGDFRDAIIVLVDGGDMFVEIAGPRRAATQRMHLRTREAVEIVELHRS
jgi:hypothetical protein